MTESLAEAMKNSDRRPASDREQADSLPQTPPSTPDSPHSTRKQQLDVMSLLKEVWGVDTASTGGTLTQGQLDRMTKAQQKFQEQQRRRQQVVPPKNEAFEQMRKGFERRYEVDEEEERRSQHSRDEL